MGTPLRVLIVEDSEDDALLLMRELQHGGLDPTWVRVDTAPAMNAALDGEQFDVVISDFTMPTFRGTDALAVIRGREIDVPFIFVSGTIGEEVAVDAMKAGAHDYIMKGNLKRLVPAIERELREVNVRREHRRIAARVQHLAYYDPLTDLPNRTLLHDRLHQALAAVQRESRSLAFLILDLDGFKEINDTLGHRVGDLLLQQVGRRIQEVLREGDTVARLGGDEFALVLPGTDIDTAKIVATRILKAIAQPFQAEDLKLQVWVSIGVALAPVHGMTPDLLMQRADVAMYVAKENKSGFVVYSAAIDSNSRQRLALGSELKQAIQSRQLVMHYQPKVSLPDKKVRGLEALMHWQHPEQGLLPPARFIGMAEETGLIHELTLAAIDMALRACRQWQSKTRRPIVAVNLSPRSLRDERFADEAAMLLQASGVAPECLELEITENVIIVDPAQALATLTRLSRMGIRLSIDDFGTGYSSLNYLKKLPVGEIKIDRSFIIDLARHGDETIVRSTIDLAHNLGMTVVAEGVETREVWNQLIALGCDAAQGFYVCPPLPMDEMTVWLKRPRRFNRSARGRNQPIPSANVIRQQ